MDKVYFLKNFNDLNSATSKWLSIFTFDGSEMTIKLHFGEPGNKTAIFPSDIKPIIDALKSLKFNSTMTDTPVAYDSQRHTVEGYTQAAEDRGYAELGTIKIAQNYQDFKTKDLTVHVAEDLIKAKNLLVISHTKGHPCSGFGGAIKNFGMGGVGIQSKHDQHNFCKPKWVAKCQGCGTCALLCPAKAIEMKDGKAEINLDTCWGCSICEIQCAFHSLAPEKAFFDDLLAQSASAVINNLPKNTFYINIIKNITKFCDCDSDSGEIIGQDLGILLSQNPIAIDQASVDLINKNEGKNIFEEFNHKDPYLHINYAQNYTNFKNKYELVEI